MSDEFEGDVLFTDTTDGGQISIVNGLVMPDRSFSTALYLSLFGGNANDGGRVDNNQTWWGNRFSGISETEKMVSKFQAIIKGLPMTSKNIKAAEAAAKEDLQWMIDEGIADEIYSEIKATNGLKIELTILVKKSGDLIAKGNWTDQWEAAANGI